MTKNIRLVEFADDEIYPIEKSAEGTNAHYCDYCNFAGYRPNYASCLRRITDAESVGLGAVEASCSVAIKKGHCPSLKLQRDELMAGKALYYINRVKMRQNQRENADIMGIRLGEAVKGKLSSGGIKTNANSATPTIHTPKEKEAPTLADAINKKLKSLSEGKVSTSTSDGVESKNKVTSDLVSKKSDTSHSTVIETKGLSLLEIARLRNQQTINVQPKGNSL